MSFIFIHIYLPTLFLRTADKKLSYIDQIYLRDTLNTHVYLSCHLSFFDRRPSVYLLMANAVTLASIRAEYLCLVIATPEEYNAFSIRLREHAKQMQDNYSISVDQRAVFRIFSVSQHLYSYAENAMNDIVAETMRRYCALQLWGGFRDDSVKFISLKFGWKESDHQRISNLAKERGYIFHCACIYLLPIWASDGTKPTQAQWYYETHSNGEHLIVPLVKKLLSQPLLAAHAFNLQRIPATDLPFHDCNSCPRQFLVVPAGCACSKQLRMNWRFPKYAYGEPVDSCPGNMISDLGNMVTDLTEFKHLWDITTMPAYIADLKMPRYATDAVNRFTE